MISFNNNEKIRNIFIYINKCNRYQVIQTLYSLRLIKKNSKAPIKLLKYLLINYFTQNIKVTLT